MRMLLLLERVPAPAECARSGIDTETVLRLADHHDVVVAVDENTSGCDALRDAGLTVHVSDKRHVYMLGDERVDADTSLAGWITTRHDERPFDVVVASSERPTFGPVREALRDVPWAGLAAAGPTGLAARLGVDRDWLAQYGHELWHAASNIAAADVVVSPVAPSVLGLDVPGRTVRLLPTREPDLRQHVTGELVVVAATGVSHLDATGAMEQALAAVDVLSATTVVVLHAPPIVGSADVRAGLAAGVPSALDRQVVLVPTERHGRAGTWLDAADALVLAGPGELLVPAIARRAALVPTVLLQGDVAQHVTSELLTDPPVPAPRDDAELLPVTTAARTAATLRQLRRTSPAHVVVLHQDDATTEATRWLGLSDLDRFDVVTGATARPPWSMANPRRLHGGLLALHRRTWNAAADELERAGTLSSLVAGLADVGGARSHTLGVVTVDREPSTVVAPARDGRPLDLGHGPLPQVRPPVATPSPAPPPAPTPERTSPAATAPTEDPSVDLRRWARDARWPARARLALPWSLGLADAIDRGEFPDGVTRWAKQHTITDRARLLLPWKWGLLPRAMEGQW